jgi:hypothetical protein
MIKKILVTGFPHCGTTILRAKVGECKRVLEQTIEFQDSHLFDENSNYDFYVWKDPFLNEEFRNCGFKTKETNIFSETIVIPIIRNPWNVFTSLYKREKLNSEFSIFDNGQGHSFGYYENTAYVVLDALKNNYKDVYPIKYEEMFDNNFEKLRQIFDKIGLQYNDTIFENRTKVYKHNHTEFIENYNETNKYDGELRAWQINQPFQNMNSEVNIPDEFSDILKNSNIIQQLGYSDPRITH